MEESDRLRTSQKTYRAHITRILNKVEATLDTEIDELALSYLRMAITQLEKKKEKITTLDQRIIDLIQDSDDLETATLDTSAQGKMVTDMFHISAQPVQTPDLEQFWNVELVGITPKDESNNSFFRDIYHKQCRTIK